ncbi:MAG: helix-turn-helix domain-containing protein [Hungatella sp.]|jgi:DNA-binding Xre family transcriptional regulator|nr:helix-turn-helix domain-containing protein [Hungatella sp.]
MDISVESQLKGIILSKHGSIKEFAQIIGMSYTTLDSILKRGVEKANVVNIIKICKALSLDVDALADGKIQSKEIIPLLNSENNATPQLMDHIKKYRKLDAHGKDLVDTVLDKEYDRVTTPKEPAMTAELRDFIIKEIPRDPDEFEKKYQPVDENSKEVQDWIARMHPTSKN